MEQDINLKNIELINYRELDEKKASGRMSGKDTLDTILNRAMQCKLFPIVARDCFYIKPFLFYANSHSTGCSIRVTVIDEETLKGLIIRWGTYWYSSNYLFNGFFTKSGAWDDELARCLSMIKEKVEDCEAEHRAQREKKKLEEQKITDDEVSNFSKIFTTSPAESESGN